MDGFITEFKVPEFAVVDGVLDPGRFPVAVMALVLCAVVGMVTGPMHGNANPFLWKILGAFTGGIGRRLDRVQRKPADLMMRGFVVLVLALILSYLLARGAEGLVGRFPLWGVTEIILLALGLTAGTVWYSLLKVYGALEKGGKMQPGAYAGIARTARTDLTRIDDFGITRVTMAMVARSFDKGLVAPVFWFLLLGLPGAYIYGAFAYFSWRFGKDSFGKGFGAVGLWLERLLGYVPMTVSGSFLAAAGLFTPTGKVFKAISGLMGRKGAAPYDEGGLPVTAMAYALNVSLGGPATDLDGSVMKRRWVGPEGATAQLQAGHLRRALYMSLMAHLLLVATLMGGMLWVERLI